MRKIIFAVFLFFVACTKENMQPEIKKPVDVSGMYQVTHVTSQNPSQFCLGENPIYDTVYLNPPADYFPPWANKDSAIDGTYYFTYVVKKISNDKVD